MMDVMMDVMIKYLTQFNKIIFNNSFFQIDFD